MTFSFYSGIVPPSIPMVTRRGRTVARIAIPLLLILALAGTAAPTALRYVRAAGLLQRIADGRGDGRLADFDRHPVQESETVMATPQGPVAARLYTPRGAQDAPGMVIVHGVHRLGINEPRLVAFPAPFRPAASWSSHRNFATLQTIE